MQRVTGIGGIFFKAKDAPALRAWYQRHLGIEVEEWGGAVFRWQTAADPARSGSTVWCIFPDTAKHMGQTAPFMINFRVADLHAVLATLRSEGCAVDEKVQESDELGKFGWVTDPEGNKVELWQPPPGQ